MVRERGLGNVPNEIFEETFKDFNLTERTHQLVETYVELYSLHKKITGETLEINNETAAIVVKYVTKQEHEDVIKCLQNYDFSDLDTFIKRIKTNKEDKMREYIINVVNECEAIVENTENSKRTMQLSGIISREAANRIIRTKELFSDINELISKNAFPHDIQSVALTSVKEGFENALKNPEVINIVKGNKLTVEMLQDVMLKEVIAAKAIKANTRSRVSRNSSKEESTKVSRSSSKEEKAQITEDSLPIQVQQSLKLFALGDIVYDRPRFFTEKYVYCPGFMSERLFSSLKNPTERVWYRSIILDGETHPIFRVELADDPTLFFEGTTPSNPWLSVLRAVEEKKRKLGLPTARNPSCSGPEFFGFASHVYATLISKKKDFDKLQEARKHSKGNISRSNSKTAIKSVPEPLMKRYSSESDSTEDSDSSESYVVSENVSYDLSESNSESKDKKEIVQQQLSAPTQQQQQPAAAQEEVYSSDYSYYYYSDEAEDVEDIPLVFNFKKLVTNKQNSEINIVFPGVNLKDADMFQKK